MTDRVVIAAGSYGTSTLFVRGLGIGAETGDGPGDGILVVQVDGANSPGQFALGAPALSSLFEYELVQDGGDWYLRTLRALDEPFEYPAILTAAQGVWHLGAGALHERMALARSTRGAVQTVSLEPVELGQLPPAAGGGGGTGFWARGLGAGLEVEADGVAFDQTIFGLQVGADLAFEGALSPATRCCSA